MRIYNLLDQIFFSSKYLWYKKTLSKQRSAIGPLVYTIIKKARKKNQKKWHVTPLSDQRKQILIAEEILQMVLKTSLERKTWMIWKVSLTISRVQRNLCLSITYCLFCQDDSSDSKFDSKFAIFPLNIVGVLQCSGIGSVNLLTPQYFSLMRTNALHIMR